MFETVTPPFNEFQKMECLARGIDNMNVNVYRLKNNQTGNDDFVALNDFWKIYQFDPISLSTIKSVTAAIPHGKHSGGFAFLNLLSSAHPLPEFGTETTFTFVSSVSIIPGIKSKMSLIRVISTTERELVAQWNVNRVPYMHSFSVTENYVIFFAAPFYVSVGRMLRYAEPFNGLVWHPDDDTKIYVVDIKKGSVRTIPVPNVFTMHHINAYELGKSNQIVVDISSYPDPSFVKNLEVKIMRDPIKRNNFNTEAKIKRYLIDLRKNTAQMQTFDHENTDVPCAHKLDMPTINENYRYKKYCYVYGVVLKWDGTKLARIAVVKKDLCRGGKQDKMWFVPNHYPVEAWFVPLPGGQSEDDGYLLMPVLDGERGQSYLAIIDAKTMKTANRAYLPTFVPYSLHGRFFPDVL